MAKGGRWLVIILAALFVVLQYKLWFAHDGLPQVRKLQNEISKQLKENEALRERNEALMADVYDLRSGKEAVDERAREDLGMVKKDETYYQIAKDPNK